MSAVLRLLACVAAACDECRDHPDADDYEPHFRSESEAVTWLEKTGWRVLAGGRLLCPLCVSRHDCGLYEHDWSSWSTCGCKSMVPRHTANGTGECEHEFRVCDRCGHPESRRREDLPTC